jgi:hypothetical protein
MKKFLVIIATALSTLQANATHLRAGEITVRQDAVSLRVIVTVTVYTNTINTNVLFGGDDDILDFGDGSDPDGDGLPGINVPETQNVMQEQLGIGIARASFTIEHTYAAPGAYVISYSEPNRNEGVINMDASVGTRFYTESKITLDGKRLYRSPETLTSPIFHAATGKDVSLALAYADSSNCALHYELVTPKRARNEDVANYRIPENFSLNEFNGLLAWDGKFNGTALTAEYAFAVKVIQTDEDNNVIGYLIRDFQIILSEASIDIDIDDNAETDDNNAIFIPESESVDVKVLVQASGVDELQIKTFSELSGNENALAVQVNDTTVEGHDFSKVVRMKLTNTQEIRRPVPYSIVLRALQIVNGNMFSQDITYLFETEEAPAPEPETPVGVEASYESTMLPFPNPVNDYLFVESPALENGALILYDLKGRKLLAPAECEGTFDFRSVSPGVYLVKTHRAKGKLNLTKVVKR